MSKRSQRWGIALAAAVAFHVGLAGTLQAGEDVVMTFSTGVTAYETGDYAAAKAAFDTVLAAEPGLEPALKMANMAELAMFFEMTDDPELKDVATRILDLLQRATRERKRQVGDAAQLLADFQSEDLTVYGGASIALQGHGPYAVPHLLALLASQGEGSARVVGRTIALLPRLQRDACLPLAVALRGASDQLVRTRIAGALGQIGDARALPALMATVEDPASSDQAREAAADAAVAIGGQAIQDLGSPADLAAELASEYFIENAAVAGYTFALTADVWQWDPSGADLAAQVVYESIPSYLYYQRMAAETALVGLAAAPDDGALQTLLAASAVRQLALCTYYASADVKLGGEPMAADLKQDAAQRAEELSVFVPVTLRMLDASVLAGALNLTLSAPDGAASLVLVRTIADKHAASGPGAMDEKTAAALTAALDSGDKDVRYTAAVALAAADPGARLAPAENVVNVTAAALQAAADRNALIVIDDLQTRNKLSKVLQGAGVATIECGVLQPRIEAALALEPSIDIVFLAGNVPQAKMARIVGLLAADVRTKAAPLYVIVEPAPDAASLGAFDSVTEVLTTNDVRRAKILPIVEKEVLAESRSAFTEDEAALVLRAARACAGIDPLPYPVADLEPPLVSALTGYGDEVTEAVIAALAQFGSPAAAGPLAAQVSDGATPALKVQACRALAAVLGRADAAATDDVVTVLKEALAGEDQALRQAAAEALSSAGLDAEDALALLRTEGLGLQ